ncbi:uncharacterized protein LOC116252495 isoform X3 [Nymphaea colorata]|uniref:uncharacterized protein LOC116252495 isoform X3 n=1 Tax=Nymphaea colorata TaxID=210225 RepID=UPI00129E9ED3|nr:uncharacterized protein LOC116252495 isoform X3 [Nymphaea colorata]
MAATKERPEFSPEAGRTVAVMSEWKEERKGEVRIGSNVVVEESMTDPLVVLGPDVFSMVLDRLDARSAARSLLVSRRWFYAACDDAIWVKKVKELWMDKAHIPRMAMMRGLSKLAAYSISFSDGKRIFVGNFITLNVLGRSVTRNKKDKRFL